MSREAISPYILRCPDNLLNAVEFNFSKCYNKIQGFRLTYSQKVRGSNLKYFYVKSYLKFQSIKTNEELRSRYFFDTFA